jgi:hypothetical protein
MADGGKPFTWSYSRLKNFETCPKRHWHVDIAKDFKEEEGESLLWGNQVHAAAAKNLSLGTPLPQGMENLDAWCKRLLTPEGNYKILVEQKLAITRGFGPTTWFGKDVWYRGVADVLKIMGPVALAIDWKTGKILDDPVQLALMAGCIFAHFPEIQKIRTEFVWLKEGSDVSSREDFTRAQMPVIWRNIWHRIETLEQAHNTTSYPPTPGRLCRKYCPVKACPHWGIG